MMMMINLNFKKMIKVPSLMTINLVMIICTFVLSACGELNRDATVPSMDMETERPLFSGAYVDESCESDSDCRNGLNCEDARCVPSSSTPLHGACIRTDECDDGLRCGWAGFCVESGKAELGGPCAQNGDCQRGAYCEKTGGIAGQCMLLEGEGADVGESCDEDNRCAEGLVCSPDRDEPICLPGSLLLNPDVFRGVACNEAEESEMDFGMRNILPHQKGDFFATPFPNDLRITDGKVDLRDYPRPGAVLNERDLFARLLNEIQSLKSGWSRNPGIFVRFTRDLDVEALEEDPGRYFKLIDLNTSERHRFDLTFVSERNKYICARNLLAHPSWDKPLTPGHSYAFLALRSLRSIDSDSPKRLDASDMLLKDRRPSEDVERVAWQRYGVLRQWLKDNDLNADDVVGATVFTVEAQQDLFVKAREAIYEANVPRFDPSTPVVLCEAGVRSPCAIDGESDSVIEDALASVRDCPEEPNPLYYEYHAKVRLPIFQRGRLPYTKDGGEVRVDEQGKPLLASYEPVCMAITVPKDIDPPENGWPVVLYGHGTGGNFRAGVKLLASQLSSLRDEPNEDAEEGSRGELKPVVLIEVDQVMHGTRLGDDPFLNPGPLFFNVQNPAAARGNLIQGAVDNFALVRFITDNSDLHDYMFPEIGQLKINKRRVAYHGHSQGGTTGPLFAPFEERLNGVAFSGTAGGLMFSLLDKKEPYDATIGLQLVLQEFNLNNSHPALHIFQEYFDDVDPINYASRLNKKAAGNPIHSLHIYGRRDTFTPDRGQRSFAAASGATLAIPEDQDEDFDLIDDLNVVTQSFPITANQDVPSVGVFTSVVVQHSPEVMRGSDLYNGHYVAYRTPSANQQLLKFLRDLSLGRTPIISE